MTDGKACKKMKIVLFFGKWNCRRIFFFSFAYINAALIFFVQ